MRSRQGPRPLLELAGAAIAIVILLSPLLALGVLAQVKQSRGLAAFAKLAPVFQHPRCMNCHRSDVPRVRDDARRHVPRVEPGEDGAGVGGQRCMICHRDENNALTRIPGRAGWRMPPYSMSWDGLEPGDICANLKDRSMNGNRDLAALAHHFAHDELIKWAWQPGTNRSQPPLSYPTFLKHVETWLEAGAPCPE